MNLSMKRIRLFLLAGFVSAIATAASAQPAWDVKVSIHNNSDTCVWVTVYSSRPTLPWVIEGGQARPRFLKANETWRVVIAFPNPGIPYPGEVRVRGEFMTNTKCDHPVKADRSADKKGIVQKGLHADDQSASLNGPPYGVGFAY